MLRFLIILGLISYVVYKIGSFFFRAGAASQQFRNNNAPPRTNAPGSIHVDHDPRDKRKPDNNKSGEYIDYEEVK